MNIYQCMPQSLAVVINKYQSTLRELRIRANKPVYADVDGRWYYVSEHHLSTSSSGAVVLDDQAVLTLLQCACDNSIYAYEDSLVNGYMTLDDGVRIGVAGTLSISDGLVKCFSSYSGMCIRFPHHIVGCSNAIGDIPKSTLVIGVPASGKTTFLRDILCRLSVRYNCVCIDDRGELSQCEHFHQFAHNVDTLLYGDKAFNMNIAIRSLSPQCIITDEIVPKQYDSIIWALGCGVKVYGSVHGNSFDIAKHLLAQGMCFEQYVLLQWDKAPLILQQSEL